MWRDTKAAILLFITKTTAVIDAIAIKEQFRNYKLPRTRAGADQYEFTTRDGDPGTRDFTDIDSFALAPDAQCQRRPSSVSRPQVAQSHRDGG